MTIYAYWHQPPTVFTARVSSWNDSDSVYPVRFIRVDHIGSGMDISFVKNGQTILFGSAPGKSDRGRCRAKATAIGDAFHDPAIGIGWAENGVHDGEAMMSVGTYVTVLNEYRLWAKIPRIELQPDDVDGNPVPPIIYMDNDIRAGSVSTFPPPVSNVGPHIAGTKDPVTGGFDVTFTVENSFKFANTYGFSAIANGAITWDFGYTAGQASIISGSTTSRTATIRYHPGVYVAHLTVNSGYGSSHTSHRLIFVRDPANDITLPHQIVSHTASPHGQEIGLKVFQKMDPDVYRDGSMVLIWEEQDNLVPAYRMIFAGWHLEDTSGFEHERSGSYGDTTFKLVDINGKLEQTPGFSQEMNLEATGIPLAVGEWNRTPYNNVLYFICFMLYWQSTALDICDLLVDNYLLPMLTYLRVTADADNLYGQVNKLANMMVPDFYLTCLRTGEMRLSVDVGLMAMADRDSFAPMQGIISSGNWNSVSVDARRAPRVYELMSGAIREETAYTYDTATPPNLIVTTFWCICPGKGGRGQGTVSQQSTNHLVDVEYTLLYVEGNRYARLNSPWGVIRVKAPWDSNQFGNMDPGYMGRVQLDFTIDEEQPPKPLPSTTFYTMIKEMSWTYDYQRGGLVRDVDFTLEIETNGPPATSILKPPGINI